MAVALFKSGGLVLVLHEEERPDDSPFIKSPPELFALYRDEMNGADVFVPVVWEVAQALAPGDMRILSGKLQCERDKRRELKDRPHV